MTLNDQDVIILSGSGGPLSLYIVYMYTVCDYLLYCTYTYGIILFFRFLSMLNDQVSGPGLVANPMSSNISTFCLEVVYATYSI